MAKKGEDVRKLEQALDKYLKEPTAENAEALKGADYVPLLSKRIAKAGGKVLRPIIDLLTSEKSESATETLKQIANESAHLFQHRLAAAEALKSIKADFDDSLRKSLIEIEKITKKDNEGAAKELFPTLNASLKEAFASAVVEHGAAKALKGASEAVGGKSDSKILRRAAHSLVSKGVKAVEIEERSEAIFKPPKPAEPEALAGHVNSAGRQFVFFSMPGGMGSAYIFQGMMDEKIGLEGFEGIETSRGSAQSFLKKGKESGGISVPPEYASWLLDKSAAFAREKGQEIPPEYLKNKYLLPPIPAEYQPPNPREKLPEAPAGAVADPLKLFDETDLPLIPDIDDLQSVHLRLDEIATSKIIINEAQRKEQIEKTFQDAAAKYLDGGGAELLADRLENSAYLFILQDKVESARNALAAADELRASESHKKDDLWQPPALVVQMFRHTLGGLEEHNHGHDHEHDHDHEHCDDPEHDHERHGDKKKKGGSGIIIP